MLLNLAACNLAAETALSPAALSYLIDVGLGGGDHCSLPTAAEPSGRHIEHYDRSTGGGHATQVNCKDCSMVDAPLSNFKAISNDFNARSNLHACWKKKRKPCFALMMNGSATYADVKQRLHITLATSEASGCHRHSLPSWYPRFAADSGRTHSPTHRTAGRHGQPWATTFPRDPSAGQSPAGQDVATHGRVASNIRGDTGGFSRVARESVTEHTVVRRLLSVVTGTTTVHQLVFGTILRRG